MRKVPFVCNPLSYFRRFDECLAHDATQRARAKLHSAPLPSARACIWRLVKVRVFPSAGTSLVHGSDPTGARRI
jgi:hypothetical protein